MVGLQPGLPPQAQFARRLAESGGCVLVPTLLDRGDTHSAIPRFGATNQPHREFIYRAAFELGEHIIGLEVQKILAAVDWCTAQGPQPVGLIGYGEGGLLALFAAALDRRILATAVCGYFAPREGLWREPIYRNLFGFLKEFGDAELAALIAPRSLAIEACQSPQLAGPPPQRKGRQGAAPGLLQTPDLTKVKAEFDRARQLVARLKPQPRFALIDASGRPPGSTPLLNEFLQALGARKRVAPNGPPPKRLGPLPKSSDRLKRQFDQLLDHGQNQLANAEFRRGDFWAKAQTDSATSWKRDCAPYRRYLSREIIGQLAKPRLAPNPRTRLLYDEPTHLGYEVTLDLYPKVFAYGILLVPKKLKPGRHPLVVCQHGLEGRPQDLADSGFDHPAYHSYGARLAQRGYLVFAPQNPYIGADAFRQLQRLANPLKLSLFSFIVRQHERILEWLATLPYVDPKRIAFYGLSYGGKSAMRLPALLDGYCLSICSADYNEWIWKNASARHGYSYLLSGEYEMPEFNLGNTFNYAEMSWLICPRPFMVERGHFDQVAPDHWVAYEYARTRRRYLELGLGDRTDIEFFGGPHTINGKGTFAFLDKFLKGGKP